MEANTFSHMSLTETPARELTTVDRMEDSFIPPQGRSMPIAVIGMGFRGPADATSVDNLWKMVVDGREGLTGIPASRWNSSAFYHPDNSRHGTMNVKGGHFMVEDPSLFDAPFFNMTGDEASAMDPQQRLLLEVTYEGFENAGIPLPKVMGSKTACFVGSFCTDYTDLLLRDPDTVPMYQCTNSGQSRAMIANRISYFFDLKGPSVTVDTACSGSLVAVHLACQSLRTGDSTMAIAAGVNIILSHEFMSTMSMMKFLSPDGCCHTFDERANGYGRGEGIGCLILKPLSDAIRDGDTVRAIIRGSGSNQDGRTPGITLPSGASQEALIRHVYSTAGLNPLETEFVETHGTGTQAGDPIEAEALSRAFGPNRQPNTPLRIGSIKTNIGHLEGASGIAGAIKAVLMLESSTLPPNRNFNALNTRIPLDEWNLKIQLELEHWTSPGPHRVSVNSFGYGGSNAHVIFEDTFGYLSYRDLKGISRDAKHISFSSWPHDVNWMAKTRSKPDTSIYQCRIFMLSGFDESSCAMQAQQLRIYLAEKRLGMDDEFMGALAYTLNERRTKFAWKFAVVGSSPSSLADALSSHVMLKRAVKRPRIGFAFTGQGAQWPGMGKELWTTYPVFRQSIEQIDVHLKQIGAQFSMEEEILMNKDNARLCHPLLSQSICSGLQIALVDLLSSWGISPDSVTGHSSGEIAAAYAAGALNMKDAMSIAYYRGAIAGKLLEDRSINGAMLAVGLSASNVQPYLESLRLGKAVVACKNSPSSVTISGDFAAIEELQSALLSKEIFCRRLAVDVAYHSHHMTPFGDEYHATIAHVVAGDDDASHRHKASFFSSVTGTEVTYAELGAHYWVENLLNQVKFDESLQALCFTACPTRHPSGRPGGKRLKRTEGSKKASIDCLIEIGPHSALAGPIRQIIEADSRLRDADITYDSVLTRGNDAATTTLTLAASLASSGCDLNYAAINRPACQLYEEPKLLVDLPPYSWNHSRAYWAEPRMSKVYRGRKHPRTDLLGVSDPVYCPFEPRWRNFLRVSEIPWLEDHKIQSNIVYPAAGYIVMAIEASSQLAMEDTNVKTTGYHLRDVSILSALVIHDEFSAVETMISLRACQSNHPDSANREYEFHIYSVTDKNKWTEHCNGIIGVQLADLRDGDSHDFDSAVDSSSSAHTTMEEGLSVLDVENFYKSLEEFGLEYGPCFANMTAARFAAGACFAEIVVPDIGRVMPMRFQHPFVVHPCTIDSVLHPIFVPLLTNMSHTDEPPVPVFIRQMFVSRAINSAPGEKLDVRTSVVEDDRGDITASLTVAARDSNSNGPVITITGLKCQRIAGLAAGSAEKLAARTAYTIEWKMDPDLLTRDGLDELLKEQISNTSLASDLGLRSSGTLYSTANPLKSANTIDTVTVPCHSQRSWTSYANATQAEYISTASEASEKDMGTEQDRAAEQLGERLRTAEEQTLSTMDYGSSPLKVYGLDGTQINASCFYAYEAAARYLDIVSHKNPEMSVLEIDAYGDVSSAILLQQLADSSTYTPRCGGYTCTHSNSSVLEGIAKRLDRWRKWVDFKTLDIGRNLDDQGFEHHSYDIIILSCGLTAVTDRHETLESIRKLLRPNGHLVLVESHDGHLQGQQLGSFNKAAGCGIFMDELRHALYETRLSSIDAPVRCHPAESGHTYSLVISRLRRNPQHRSMNVLVIAEGDDCGVSLSDLRNCVSRFASEPEISDLAHANPIGRVCIVLSDLQQSVFAKADEEMLGKLKQIFLQSTGILWVTRGGSLSVTNPDAGLVTGFARTARSESGASPIVTLDLDGRSPISALRAAEVISDLVRHSFFEGDPAGTDVEYAERHGVLRIPRVVENISLNQAIATLRGHRSLSEQTFYQKDRPLRAVTDDRMETVYFTDNAGTAELLDTFIGAELRAACLSDDGVRTNGGTGYSGTGYSGTVCSVGKAVSNFAPGDRVAYLGSAPVTSIHHGKESAFQKVPKELSLEAAAALPTAYCTAFYVINNIARIGPNDTVLVHGVSGPNGQALVELCLLRQARVLATVKTTAQQHVLVSRYQVPESQVLLLAGNEDITSSTINRKIGEGLNIVIDSRGSGSNKFAKQLWKCILPYGRYIALGNGDTAGSPQLGDGPVFSTFDIRTLWKQSPTLVDRVWKEVMCLFSKGKLKGPSPLPTYSITNISDALAACSQSGGSVILTAEAGDTVKATLPRTSHRLLKSDASYMLVGGLGGIGRVCALWMADHGAKHLIFVNRSGLANTASRATVQALEEKGVHVVVQACDVADQDRFHNVVSELSGTVPPIRGVIQAAMVLKDTHIEKMTIDDYRSVLQPKYTGTWNLHRALPMDMDFFVLLSSISGVIGNATQSSYAAGSTFMDSFAAYRNSIGLPAVSLDLGPVTDAGYLAENKELAAKMAQQGFNGIDTRTLLSLVEAAISEPCLNGRCSQIITGLGEWKEGQSLSNLDTPLFAQFRHQFSRDSTGRVDYSAGTLREELRLAKSLEEATGLIYSALSQRIANRLSIPVESINPSSPVSEYGIDSHIAVELRNWISKQTEGTVPVLEILSSSSLLELSAKIGSRSQLVCVGLSE